MQLVDQFGACDCHSHVFGPFHRFPLSEKRTFDPPEAPIEVLEDVWRSLGLTRAVVVQGSAHGDDHRAMLAAIERSPRTRKGVAILSGDESDEMITTLHRGGVRAVRFNWVPHLLGRDPRSEKQRLYAASGLLERISSLSWHAEVHIDLDDLELVTKLDVPHGMPIVIDHMARIDASDANTPERTARLLRFLDQGLFWVKLSGADRLTAKCDDLRLALAPMQQIIRAASARCVWGLDWPHVNLNRKRSDIELAELLLEVAGEKKILEQLLIHNPAKLYGFDPDIGQEPNYTQRRERNED